MPDSFFSDVPSQVDDPRGIPYPQCWCEEVLTSGEGEPELYEWRLKAEHQAYPWTPAIVGTHAGRNVYFELGTTRRKAYQDAGLYLGGTYYEMAHLYPDISRRCADVEFEGDDGHRQRCKLHDLPSGKTAMGIFAPVKYSGVDAPTDPPVSHDELFPTAIKEISTADSKLIQLKDLVKVPAISWLKGHPKASESDLEAWVLSKYGKAASGMAACLMEIYRDGAAEKGLIQNKSWIAFRDWIVSTPVEILVSL